MTPISSAMTAGIDILYEDISSGTDTVLFISSTRGVTFHYYN